MGHPIRVRLVEALVDKELCVSALNELVSIDQSTLSRHLAQLKRSGLVAERRDGPYVRHRLANPCVVRLLKSCREVLSCRLETNRDVQ